MPDPIDCARPTTIRPKRRRTALVIGIAVAAGLLCLIVAPYVFLGSTFSTRERTLIRWRDSPNGITVRVTEKPTFVKTNSRLYVNNNSIVIDDDATWDKLSLVHWREWLLVLDDNYVLAAYNYNSGKLYGEGDWKEIPFTV